MRRKYFVSISVFAVFLLVCVLALCVHSSKVAYGKAYLGQQCQQIVNALNVQANYRGQTGEYVDVDADSQSVVTDLEKNQTNKVYANVAAMPSKFDLRSANLDGSGAKNYVTSVKFQNPWGSCWAFGGIAASETSILSELGQSAVSVDTEGNMHDTLDLSEHHLSWFNYSPMLSTETATQAGEGAYSTTEEKAKTDGNPWWISQRMATGGVAMSTFSSFAAGMGPVVEPNFNDPNVSPVVRQLLYKGINGTIKHDEARGRDYYDSADDWSIDYSQRFNQSYKLEEGIILPNSTTPPEQPYSKENADYVTGLMKEQLLQGHALNIAFKADNSLPGDENRPPKYINTETWAHYTWEQTGASHDVTVVGWDDDYSLDNFLTEIPKTDEHGQIIYDPETGEPIMIPVPKPEAKGAWIVKNSWGALDSWGQGLNKSNWGLNGSGYFYMSYYDRSLKTEAAYDYDVNHTSATTITNQLNFMPCEQPRAIEQSAPVATANVFVANQCQNITEVGIDTSTENESINVKVYKLNDACTRIDQGELLCDVNASYTYKGFHRLNLGQSLYMNQGDKFAVSVTQQSGNKYLLAVASDANKEGAAAGKAGDSYYCNAIVNAGESYLYTSSDDTWTDWTVMKNELETDVTSESHYYTYDNFPIKAFGVPAEPLPQPSYETAATGDITNLYIGIALLIVAIAFAVLRKNYLLTK